MGVNAIEKSIPVMNELILLKDKIEKRRSKVQEFSDFRKKQG